MAPSPGEILIRNALAHFDGAWQFAPMKLAFLASHPQDQARLELIGRYGQFSVDEADVIVALGGDGFMLKSLHAQMNRDIPIYGMNRGTVGFLMNEFSPDALIERISVAETATVHPLRMRAHTMAGEDLELLAINEVSLLRSGSQAARLRLVVNGRERLSDLVCDGLLVSTPAGSTAYNYSAHGPIIPIGANILAITAVAAFRPRRWRGALVNQDNQIRIEVQNPEKRPVHCSADSVKTEDIRAVDIAVDTEISLKLLFDPGHGLEERLLNEQFM